MSLMQLIYASDLAGSDEQTLTAILSSAVRHNQENGVTGMLIYSNNRFLQVLEGESADVDETYSRIAADRRHQKIVPLLKETIATRSFDNWSMGFRHLENHDFKEYPQYLPYFGIDAIDFDGTARPSIALEMLKIFSKLPA